MQCNHCGEKINQRDKFCGVCGQPTRKPKPNLGSNEITNKSGLKIGNTTLTKKEIKICAGIILALLVVTIPIPYRATEAYYEKQLVGSGAVECKDATDVSITTKRISEIQNRQAAVGCIISNNEEGPINIEYTIASMADDGILGLDGGPSHKIQISPKSTVIEEHIVEATPKGTIRCIFLVNRIPVCSQKKIDRYNERQVTKYATVFQLLTGQAQYYYKVG
ncbi:MAG TPA: hypothetical protein VJG90_02010 [Candidatus Nanoarchaeia archaeon]|nr:hypothetical protein [Candidatus Nanoarchaeia archaeon]